MLKQLISWSKKQYSHLPWRLNRDPYITLVSEVMLQQTTVGTVSNHFPKFLKKYPTVHDLAQIDEEEMLISWKGLGYYRRAKNLLRAAKTIETDFSGVIPSDLEKLLMIPGIGLYTAHAIRSIGHNKKALALDTNLMRVLSRLYLVDSPWGVKLQKSLLEHFYDKKILEDFSSRQSRAINEALMDLGRVYCKRTKPECEFCPVEQHCQAYAQKKVFKYPVILDSKNAKKESLHLARFFTLYNGKLACVVKRKGEWLSGQMELPTFMTHSSDRKLKQYPVLDKTVGTKLLKGQSALYKFNSVITKYKIENSVYILPHKKLEKLMQKEKDYIYKEIKEDEYKAMNLSSASLKAIEGLKKQGHV